MLSTVLEWNRTPKDMCRITRRHDWLLHGLFHILADWRRFPRSNCISETTLQGKAPPFYTGNWFYSCSLATRSFMWWRVLGAAHMQYHTKLQKKSIFTDLTSRILLTLNRFGPSVPWMSEKKLLTPSNPVRKTNKLRIWTQPACTIDNKSQFRVI